jgi:hypothetical protein
VARRRQQVFADDSGARWRALAGPCIREVSEVIAIQDLRFPGSEISVILDLWDLRSPGS